MSKKNKPYTPNLRTGYEPKKHSLESYGKTNGMSKLPNCVEDDIVSNNIANNEFNYTEDLDVD